MEKYTGKDYYSTIQKTLTITAQEIKKSNIAYDYCDYAGRIGSTRFESMIKACIRENMDSILYAVNKNLSNGWVLENIDASENLDDTSERSMSDITLTIIRPDKSRTVEHVNIKATAGKTADNVGGWASLYYSFYGVVKPNASKSFVLNEFSINPPLFSGLHDYFLWVFNKKSDSFTILCDSSSVHSYFTSVGGFVVNISQSFPLQFNAHNAKIIDYHPRNKKELLRPLLSGAYQKKQEEAGLFLRALKSIETFGKESKSGGKTLTV